MNNFNKEGSLLERMKILKVMKIKKTELIQRRAEEIVMMIKKNRNVVKPMMIVGINVISRMMKSKLIVRHLNVALEKVYNLYEFIRLNCKTNQNSFLNKQ